MGPAIEGVKRGLAAFTDKLRSDDVHVDYRLRLIAFRDLQDRSEPETWIESEFTASVGAFAETLGRVQARCNQRYAGAESALDALYRAIHSRWRSSRVHRAIVLITDDDTWKNLHPTTYALPDNGVDRVIAEFQTLRHLLLYIVAPRLPTYELLERSVGSAGRTVISEWLGSGAEREEVHARMQALNWLDLLASIGESVSSTSVAVLDPD